MEDDDWRDLPPPPPPAEIGLLPVLGVAPSDRSWRRRVPHGFHHDGSRRAGNRRLPQAAFAPPPLPANIKPVAPPAPVAAAAGAAPVADGGGGQAAAADWRAPRPARRAGRGSRHTRWCATRAGRANCCRARGSRRRGPAAEGASGLARHSQSARPAGPPCNAGGKPLPTPVAPPAAAVAPVAPITPGGKPLPAASGGKPLPTLERRPQPR